MGPAEFRLLYLSIGIDIPIQMSTTIPTSDSTIRRVAVKEYRSRNVGYMAGEKARLITYMRNNGFSASDRTAAARAFMGKASFSQCQRAVTAIWRSGFAGSDLQGYCDTNLGLDCTGFVNNYFSSEHDCQEMDIPS